MKQAVLLSASLLLLSCDTTAARDTETFIHNRISKNSAHVTFYDHEARPQVVYDRLVGEALAAEAISLPPNYSNVYIDAVIAGDNAEVVDEAGRTIDVRPQLKGRVLRAREAGWFD